MGQVAGILLPRRVCTVRLSGLRILGAHVMFAVVKSGGKQYRVREGEELLVDRVKGEVGQSVELPVGFSLEGSSLDLTGRTAKVEILEHLRGDKIHVYKYKPKKDHRKKTGHRQELTRIKVLEVSDGS